MLKGRGNIDYFQKNKKIVLSFIGVSFLTGAAVIDKDVPGREIADVHRAHPDEKLKAPPHRVVPKDKLPLIKPKNKPMALLYNGWISLGKIGYYDVKYRSFGISSGYVYQFIGTYGTSQLGFGCICANINKTPTWKGMYDSQCSTSAISDNPLDLGDVSIMGSYAISGIPIPGGACCRDLPRVDGTSIPGVSCP